MLPQKRVFLSCALLLSSALFSQAAVLVHRYELNGTLADSLGGPSLTSNGGSLGPTGITFSNNQGPSLSNGINAFNYSILMSVSLDQITGYRKLIDFKNRSSDSGFYNLSSSLNFYPVTSGPGGAIVANQLHTIAITRDAGTTLVAGYVDGTQQFTFTGSSLAVFDAPGSIIHFLRDDLATGGGESASGFIDWIRIYDGALTAREVENFVVPEASTFAMMSLVLGSVAAFAVNRRRSTKA